MGTGIVGIAKVLVPLLIAVSAGAELPGALRAGQEAFYAAYAAWDLSGFKEAARHFEQACEAAPEGYPAQYWLGAARFHVVLHRNRARAPWNEVKELIESAEDVLKRAVELNDGDAEAHAMLATLTGMRISEKPLAAVWLGPRVMKHRRAAEKHGAENPRVHYLAGAGYLLGDRGREEKALAHFERALELFPEEAKRDRPDWAPTWGHANCLAFAGQACQRLARVEQARAYFEQALEKNPRNRLAREGMKAIGAPREEPRP